MKKDLHFASGLLMYAGALLAVSGILMAVCGEPAYSGSLWAGASCMFFTACHFQVKEEKLCKTTEDTEDGQQTVQIQ